MEQINDLEMACNIVRKAETKEEREKVVQKLFAGTVDVDNQAGKALLHRRALLMTELTNQKLWPWQEPKDKVLV